MKHFLFTSLISVAVFSLILGFSKMGYATGNGMSGGGTGTLYQKTFVFFDLLKTI